MEKTLGQYLASIRTDRKMTLRAVEKATDRKISNAYLSQIENDKIRKPSPNILHALAEIYGISFERLMDLAGYFVAATKQSEERHARVAAFAEHHLTPEEESELLRYLQFLRTSRKLPRDKT